MRYIRIACLILLFCAGVFVGIVCKKYPFIAWNKEVKLYEIAQLLVTLSIGLIIPFLVKRIIDDKRNLKTTLIEECKDTLMTVNKIYEKISLCKEVSAISSSDKDQILVLFSNADLKVNNLYDNLEFAFNNNNKGFDIIKTSYVDYWKVVTGGELMSSSYLAIDGAFYQKQSMNFSFFEKSIRRAIIQIHRL